MIHASVQTLDDVSKINLDRWQNLINTVTELFDAASGDIVQVQVEQFEVLVTSDTANNFLSKHDKWDWSVKSFCKYIAQEKTSLYVGDAANHPEWKDAPFVASGQVCSYIGQPILWPNGEVFGTFCVIDNKVTHYSEALKRVLLQLKFLIESDLQYFCAMQELEQALNDKEKLFNDAQSELLKRKRKESQLVSQEAIVSALLGELADAVVRINGAGRIISVNNQVEKMFGYRVDELIGQNVKCLMPKQYSDHHDTYLANYLRTGQKRIMGKGRDVTAMRKDGSEFPVRLSVSELEVDGQLQFLGLIEDNTEQVEYQNRLKAFALYDNLTQCANRNLLAQRFSFHIAASNRSGVGFSVAYIDLNKFKPINDTYSHQCGDKVLTEIGQRLINSTRETDLVARVGGDEFVILFSEPINAERIESQLTSKIAEPINCCDESVVVSACIGHSAFPEDGSTMDALLEVADREMYKKKHG